MAWAADQGHLDIVKFLWEKDIPINPRRCRRGNGITPLMFAARGGHVDIVQFLLKKGADIAGSPMTYIEPNWNNTCASMVPAP